jgi:hypothetical protein
MGEKQVSASAEKRFEQVDTHEKHTYHNQERVLMAHLWFSTWASHNAIAYRLFGELSCADL